MADIDVYVARHSPAWHRLDALVHKHRLSGAEVDELVDLYRRTSHQLAQLQARAPEPQLISGLTVLLTRVRGRLLAGQSSIRAEFVEFFARRFPMAVYHARRWWVGVAVMFLVVATGLGIAVAQSKAARAALVPANTDSLTAPGGQFETYYSEHPHAAFAAEVWTNNVWVSAVALFTGVLLLPAAYALFMNALNIGVSGGLMAHAGRLDAFFSFIAPHGMLELTAIFVAGGAGLRLGWTVIDPGPISRARALARNGRAAGVIALGLVATLLVSGIIEGFVTPSGWPTPVRIGIGALAELGFLGYVYSAGRNESTLSCGQRYHRLYTIVTQEQRN